MSDVFISHAEEDAAVALEIARGLNAAGYSTWCYEEDNDPGLSYLTQIGEAIEACQAVVLVISPDSLGSDQVTREVEFSHEARKRFVPVLRGISHVEFQNRRASWRVALGTASTIPIPPEGVSAILPRIVRGLQGLGVKPAEGERTEADRREREKAEAEPKAEERAEQDRVARERAEAKRKSAEQAEIDRRARENEEQLRRERDRAEAERRAGVKAEAERKAQEENKLGLALWQKGDLQGAITKYRQALQLKPDLAEAHNNLGLALLKKGDCQGAIAEVGQALQLKPDLLVARVNLAVAHNNFGLALLKTRNRDRAIAEFRQALQLKPDLAEAHNNLGFALLKKRDVNGAMAECRKALELKPDLAVARKNLVTAKLHKRGLALFLLTVILCCCLVWFIYPFEVGVRVYCGIGAGISGIALFAVLRSAIRSGG